MSQTTSNNRFESTTLCVVEFQTWLWLLSCHIDRIRGVILIRFLINGVLLLHSWSPQQDTMESWDQVDTLQSLSYEYSAAWFSFLPSWWIICTVPSFRRSYHLLQISCSKSAINFKPGLPCSSSPSRPFVYLFIPLIRWPDLFHHLIPLRDCSRDCSRDHTQP